MGRNSNTQQEFDNIIYRAQRFGLNAGQRKIWQGLARWFDMNVDGPTTRELAEISGVSITMVYWTIPVLETMNYITVTRKNGRRKLRTLRLWVYPEEWTFAEGEEV